MSKITRPNINNTSPAYWEKVLASHGLGVDQPLTDNSNELTTGEATSVIGDDFLHLRRKIDKGDRFMEAHEIKKTRGSREDRTFGGGTSNRICPEWALDDKLVREVLLRAFPRLYTSEAHRKRAGRWMRAIYLYYRMRLSRQIVAKEMGISLDALKALNRSMNRVAQKLRADGSGKRMPPSVPPFEGVRREEK